MLTIRMNCALRRCGSKLHESVHAQQRVKCARGLLCFQENDMAKAPVGTEVVFSCWRASVLARSWCGGGGDGGSHWPGSGLSRLKLQIRGLENPNDLVKFSIALAA